MKKKPIGIVYSTNLDFQYQYDEQTDLSKPISPMKQSLKIKLDTRHRAGKQVTLIEGFVGNPNEFEKLSKELKNKCGTGGSVKDRVILIQGDFRKKIQEFLTEKGHSIKIL